MRILNDDELKQVSGGGPKWRKIDEADRALPGTDVTPLSGNRTGWCRGFGNVKNGLPKHSPVIPACGCNSGV